MFKSGNPSLKGDVFSKVVRSENEEPMTIQGAVNKSFIMLALIVGCAMWAWSNPTATMPYFWAFLLGGFALAIITIFNKTISPYTAPIYAVMEGFLLGVISLYFEKSYPGIVMNAVTLTFGTFFCMLVLYKTEMIKVTEKFRLGVFAATGGIALIYIVNIVMSFFGARISFIHEGGLVGIGFSVFVVVIAALNLVMDFDFIERGAQAKAPKYMEWYGAVALMITLIWLYLEILRLLAKVRR